jgi:general stress protein YciG
VTKLIDEFSRKEWKDCCGKGCKKCQIAQAYIEKYGDRKVGLEKLNADRDAVKKAGKKGGKTKGSKKSKARKKAKV